MTDRIASDLAGLRTTAPAKILPGVLAATGLADRYVTRDTPIGTLYLAFNDRGVSCVDLAEDDTDFEDRFEARFDRQAVRAGAIPALLSRRIDKAVAEGKPGDLPLDLGGLTDFQRDVLLKTAEIPPSEIRPYGWVAREIGRPGAVRAVGSALAANPVPIVVPCHRVVRSDGRFGNYSLGDPANKVRLLEAEGLDTDAQSALAARGVRFIGSDTTRIFCLPACRHVRRITDAHRVEFRTESAARDDGYRPCTHCRPAAA